MSYMFYNCLSLTKIIDDLENFNNNIGNNEEEKYKLKTKWETKKVTNMTNMFNGCESLLELPKYISKWDMSQVKYMSYMFSNCKSLKYLPKGIINWKTSNVIHINNIFENCSSLEELPNITKWDIKQLVDINYIIEGCDSLKNIPDFSQWKKNSKIIYKEGKLFDKNSGSNKADDKDNDNYK